MTGGGPEPAAEFAKALFQLLVSTVAPRNPGTTWAQFVEGKQKLACARLRDLAADVAERMRQVRIDPTPVLAVARAASPGCGLSIIPLVHHAQAAIEELGHRTIPTRKRKRSGNLDALAISAVRMFQDPDSPNYRPGWTAIDVAKELGVHLTALTGRQRDGTPRCPKFSEIRKRRGWRPNT